jgi:hypothetical protein
VQREEITIRVDALVARVYRAASEQDRRRLDMLLSQRALDFLADRSLQDVMREISRKALMRGMTPEILASILDPL